MRMTTTAALALFCATSAVAQQNDWLIVPGKRLGPITTETSRTTLVRLFGKSNVNDQDVDTGEGPEPATVVLAKDPSAALAILWQDDRIDRVLVCFESEFGPCKWHTADGVSLGTSLPTLETLNGRPFVVEAWGSDGGGNVISWRGGRLANELGDGGDALVLLTLYWRHPMSGLTLKQIQADKELDRLKRNPRSSDSALRGLHAVVDRMELVFPSKNHARR